MRIDTPAKINLFLEVLSKRGDGFHEIETLMAGVSLYDTLYFESQREGQITVNCRWASGMEASQATWRADNSAPLGDLPQGRKNIVWKALESFQRETGAPRGAAITLIKRIPSAAGLGGASSDAAAGLIAANHAWQTGWSRQELAEFGARLGSDISFFIDGGVRGNEMAICQGRGEKITQYPSRCSLDLVVIRPPEGLSTPAVYQKCSPAAAPASIGGLLDALHQGNPSAVGRCLLNRLEEPAAQLSSSVDRLRSLCRATAGLGHQLSGSGTSHFVVCHHRRHAFRVAATLKARSAGQVFVVRTVAPSCRIDPLSA